MCADLKVQLSSPYTSSLSELHSHRNPTGYKCVIYMPNTQSQGKIDLLRLLGAEVYPVPAVAFENPENYNHQARRHAEKIGNAVWTNQFDNTANRQAHIETT